MGEILVEGRTRLKTSEPEREEIDMFCLLGKSRSARDNGRPLVARLGTW